MRDSRRRIVSDLLSLLRDSELDTKWTRFENGDDLIVEVQALADRIARSDPVAEREMTILFAPTGVLQDTAIASGFGDQYMSLAERWDRLTS